MNLLAFPGLGTIMAGRAIGYTQATVMVAGFGLAVGFMIYYFWCMAHFATSDWSEEEFRSHYREWLWALWLGCALSLAAWCWALVSTIGILRRASKAMMGQGIRSPS